MLNNVVLSVIACLENKFVIAEIEKKFIVKIKKLENYNTYLNSEEIKDKKVTKDNFTTCINFTIKNLGSEKFRLFCQYNEICLIAFYPKGNEESIRKINNISRKNDSTLDNIIINHSIDGDTLYVYTNPVISFKNRLLENKESIINQYANENTSIKNLEVRFVYNDKVLDDLSQCFLDLGYNIK